MIKLIASKIKIWLIALIILVGIVILSQIHNINTSDDHPSPSCVSCHLDVVGFSNSHNPEAIGCTSCHLGNALVYSKDAHEGMVAIPGNLTDANKTCAQDGCHVGIDHRVENSLMNTMSGVVGVDKFIFGECSTLDSLHSIQDLEESAADIHLRQLCASCHIGSSRIETGPITELTRGGGCNACHLNYSPEATMAHFKYIDSDKTDLPSFHPSLSLNISDDHCFGCHSRSARISTNYEGWHELVNHEIHADSTRTRQLEDGRLFEYKGEDVHHKLGLECIDCHGSYEVMGDGNLYAHQEDAVKISCSDCHTNSIPKTINYNDLTADMQRIVRLRKFPQNSTFVIGNSGRPIINVSLQKDQMLHFTGKNTKKSFILTPPSSECTQAVHSNIACETCHTSWAPQCISCHTHFDTTQLRFDHLTKGQHQGKWIEKGDIYLGEFPILGVIEDNEIKQIKTFIQGMTMTLDKSEFSKTNKDIIYERRMTPTFAHTISSRGQTCSNCHRNPVALGFGRGELVFNTNQWLFAPSMELSNEDGLPLDAWIGFLNPNSVGKATRTNAQSLSIQQQRKILGVGACLTCHDDDSDISKRMLEDFTGAQKRMSSKCRWVISWEWGRNQQPH